MANLQIENLVKRFGNSAAVNELSLSVHDGECFVILGPTGAGKTTTLRCIAGLEKPDVGSIKLDGREITGLGPAQRDVALVFQQYSLYPNLTVKQNLEFPLRAPVRSHTQAEIDERIARVSDVLRIEHLLDRKTDKLSGGEMQRVSIGRAIVRDPQMFLLDEPLSNLDAKLREVLRGEIRDLRQRLGATMLLVTHDQVEALSMGDRIGVLNAGQLIQVGTPDEIYNRPCNRFVAGFVGSPAMNLFEVDVGDSKLRVPNTQLNFQLPLSEIHTKARAFETSEKMLLGIRPEDVSIDTSGTPVASVFAVEDLGAEKLVTMTLMHSEIRIRSLITNALDLRVGQMVAIEVAPEKYHCFNPRTEWRLAQST